ncbi:hypothetical protein FHR70_002675 [Microvirga lupini]|uniref:Secreted protein n=1 Tax=Microvirga lupini TaxID=420324 RepID=A0A7W4YWM5_9HYPH|nr:hypothetical protein [Microvirga lupini]MBB3019610.1 hypothetical protein [Microvirga lupini]
MNRHHTLAWFACSVLSVATLSSVSAQQHTMPRSSSDQEIIRSAMAAAPPAIAKDATIIDVSKEGKIRSVRKGTNNFTCMADNPSTPGPDPMCGDENAMAWAQAWIEHKDPPAGKVGFMYMLAGGTDASNTDPYAQQPEPNNNWVKTGPHVMVVGAKGMMEGYPRAAMPDTSRPYVMWAGTPYEHLMLPVQTSKPMGKTARR